jgi:hypothetical protein
MGKKVLNPLLEIINKEMNLINPYRFASPDVIKITMTPTAGFVAGINLTFASGTLTIDWKDGSVPENFTSGVEKTHTYASAGTYIVEISGSITNITKFIADTCRITLIENLKTGLLTQFELQSNLYSGILDMSLAPISVYFKAQANAGLTSVVFASVGNAQISTFRIDSCNLSTLNLENVPITGLFYAYSNANLSSITFATSGNGKLTDCRISGCNYSTLNFANVPVSGLFYINSCSNLTSTTFSSTGNTTVTDLEFYGCPKLTGLDLTNVPVSTTLSGYNCSLFTSITFKNSGNSKITTFNLNSCKLTGTLDLSNVPVGGTFQCHTNSLLTTITFSSTGNSIVTDFRAYSCNLTGTLDLTNVPVGTLFYCYSNVNLTDITFATSGNGTITYFVANSCNLTGDMDFKDAAINATGVQYIYLQANPNLTGIIFKPSGNGYIIKLYAYTCDLGYINFNVGFNLQLNNTNIDIKDNSMTVSEVNHILVDLDSISSSGYTGRLINIGGTNADPDGSSGGYDGLTAKSNLEGKGITVTIT